MGSWLLRRDLIDRVGAWYPSTAFDPVINKLPGYHCQTLAYPSIQQATTVQDFQADIDTVWSLVQQEADKGHDVPDGDRWAQALGSHAYVTMTLPATSSAYLHIPSSDLLCEED
ncbi:uncharacterized protein BP01DRAFT_392823 [Aspergillus saccharolyticus JOP 1030-1]|uniref:Uncharacterized protein n=1 Tax=Aspergillus saccharolyticus JOP 1030-1 TaxID=1450539 RepID=A0A318ZVY5_9EURO|nr:hypothetical protein BP01DRAFT_392823 [Aspergillus saccharolyticus JOP 1030-1]PYH44298.1 hypothetical protein BP01DRAFT_392823 [Aspergillus saccharolyticus JOP 1030-1]